MRTSPRHALEPREILFCKFYAAFGFDHPTEAYRRAWYPPAKDKDGNYVDNANMASPDECSRQAKRLLDKAVVQAFLEELKMDAGARARDVLAEQVTWATDPRIARDAAKQILDQEDKLGFRDAVEEYAEMMCALGAEVVVPLPGGGEAAFAFREMYPRYADSLPPIDVLKKTERALRGYREKLEAEEAE